MSQVEQWILDFLNNPTYVIVTDVVLVLLLIMAVYRHQVRFMLKSLTRNGVRTVLTSLATMVLVFVVTLVWSVLSLLDKVTTEKSQNVKAIVTEKWQIPSQMPLAYAASLSEGGASKPDDVKPTDAMTWQFYGGTTDTEMKTRESMVFFFCMEPRKLLTMMDGLEELTGAQRAEMEKMIRMMEEDPTRVVVGQDRLKAMNKKVGERISIVSINYKDINLSGLEIIGTFPPGQYDQSAVMNMRLLNNALDTYKINNKKPHPLDEKRLALVWLKVPDTAAYNRVAEQIEKSPSFTTPPVKCETSSSGFGAFLDAYRDLLWGMRWLLVPAILATMALVIANAISISVRERRTEMAVLKVLGYGPTQIMFLVLGEALLIGVLSGLVSAGFSYIYINMFLGGIKFPIAFFPAFMIPPDALWWGPAIGGITAFIGSIVPSLTVRAVKVSEVFSKVG